MAMSNAGSESTGKKPVESDAELVARIRSGDRQAEAALVQRYLRPVLLVLQKRLNNPDLARDLAQEVFLIVFGRLRSDGIEDPDRLAGFLRRTAIHLALGERKKSQRQRTDTVDQDDLKLVIDASSGPLLLVDVEQTGKLVRQLIAELPLQRDRELLQRYYVDGQDRGTLLQDYALSAEHFDRVMHRARSRLRELMEKHGLSTNPSGRVL
jgi:RNA polymerase sigma factor (sigma-70 family)